MCKSGYSPASLEATNNLPQACTTANNIINCSFHDIETKTVTCQSCNKGYAVKSDNTSCVSYSGDSACQKLQSDGKSCHECWWSYYWNATECKLNSNLMMLCLSALAFFAL